MNDLFGGLRGGIGGGNTHAFAVSNRGQVRKDNQDHFLVLDALRVYVVADGMGGGSEGSLASEIVCRHIKETVSACESDFAARVFAVKSAIVTANREIFEYSVAHGYEQMGTTVAALVLDMSDSRHGATLHVGDSRVYRLHGQRLIRLTRDHRFGFTNALTRAVGVEADIAIDVGEVTFDREDKAFVCTDGVHGFATDSEIAGLLSKNTPVKAANGIAKAIERAGALDNYTFIIVR